MQSLDKPETRASNSEAQQAEQPLARPSVRPAAPQEDLLDRIWRVFCSMRLALILILLIAATIFIGTMLDQAPGGLTAAEYASWLGGERIKYGSLADLFSALQFFSVYTSFYFKLLLALLMMNIVVCTTNRWNGIWTIINKPRIRMNESFFRKAGKRAAYTEKRLSVGDAAEAVTQVLKKRRFRVLSVVEGGSTYLYADKNRYFKLGTFVSHFSFIVLLTGVILGLAFGFREQGLTIPEGSTRAVGYGTNLSVKCVSFADTYYEQGGPKDYRSDLVLYKNGTEVARQTIHVNDPLQYDGITFYQSFFGPAVIMQVKDKNGQTIYNDGVALAWTSTTDAERAMGSFDLPSAGVTAYVVEPHSGGVDPLIPVGDVRIQLYRAGAQTPAFSDNVSLGQSKTIGGLTFTFVRERQFTGLQVSRDPGTWLIWLASALFVLGTIMVFYFPHRRLWALCHADAEGKTEVLVGAQAGRDLTFSSEFDGLANQIHAGLRGSDKA